MNIALGADHAGFELKEKLKRWLLEQGFSVEDCGTNSSESCDYPDFARAAGEQVVAGRAALGIMVCGTGIGMAMSANKMAGIRAANAHSEFEAEMARAHNDANVLALGARVLSEAEALKIVDKFLRTDFAGGRHQRRVDKIMALERGRTANAAGQLSH
jgi:ribose 5-phosphate isomerase B